jgi:hypothetical protein
MSIPRSRALAIFKKLGAADPVAWATREADQPALARWLLLTGFWRCVEADDDGEWMEGWADDDDPIPAAIRRMLERGIDPADLTAVARYMQVSALYNVCRLLDDSEHGIEDLHRKMAEQVRWRLVEDDDEEAGGVPGRPIENLHQEFREFDPTGRRGHPKKSPRRARGTRSP